MLPKTIDNTYRGQKAALWILGLLALMKLVIGINSIINGDVVMAGADGIPLATYPASAAQTLVALWALLGLSHLVTSLLCVLVLIRYRSLTAFMLVLLLFQNLGGRVILYYIPLVRTGAPPASTINLIHLTLMIAGLALSLWRRRSYATTSL
ncbi:MAG: hypothetical protein QOC81_848 [Thermoanaerobaculia bacterium]|jgi:hypothetical protein|nr:hypothetical protein [Thermoanaerobaculia bacterium]